MGRASTYNQTIADEIVERISNGEPLRAICRDGHMPAWRTVYDWINANPDFATKIARARELGYDAIAQQALEIADTPVIGESEEVSEQGRKIRREDMLGHRKLQVWTRLQLLAKWCPSRYGDRITNDVNFTDRSLSPEERETRVKALLEAARKRKADKSDEGSDLI